MNDLSPDDDPRPVVRLPRSGVPGGALALGAALLAVVLFVVLDGRRDRLASATRNEGPTSAFRDPPALAVPLEAAVPSASLDVPTSPPTSALVGVVQPVIQTAPLPAPQNPPMFSPPVIVPVPPSPSLAGAITAALPSRGAASVEPSASAFVIDTGPTDGPNAQATGAAPRPGTSGAGAEDAPVRAAYLRNRTDVMPVGTLIPAVLETPIDTARPGLVRAVVSRDTRGFDGRRVLVPRGSRLVGEYQAEVRGGQNRVLVTWNRLIRPDGVTMRLASPAADELGGAGVPGRVNTFFFERFASAVLQSALTVGVNLASRPGRGSVIVGLPAVNNAVGQQLLPTNDLRPKITVRSGAMVNVFVARDLDFSGTGSRP